MCDIEVDKSLRRPPATPARARRAARAASSTSAVGVDPSPTGTAPSPGATGTTPAPVPPAPVPEIPVVPDEGAGAGAGISTLVSFVPAEAIAAYVILLPFMDPSGEGFTGRWLLALGVAVLSIIYAIGYRKIAAVQAQSTFAIPWIPIFTTVFAFGFWVFAIPDSPFNEFSFYTPELGGATGVVGATLISFVGAVTGVTLTIKATEESEPQ